MKKTFIKMAPDTANALQNTIGIGYASDPEILPEGSGFTLDRWIEYPDLAEYCIMCDEAIFDAAIAEMLAHGLTMTFRP